MKNIGFMLLSILLSLALTATADDPCNRYGENEGDIQKYCLECKDGFNQVLLSDDRVYCALQDFDTGKWKVDDFYEVQLLNLQCYELSYNGPDGNPLQYCYSKYSLTSVLA